MHPGRAGHPDQAVSTPDIQHHPTAPASPHRAAAYRRRRPQRRSCPGSAGGSRHPLVRSASPSGWWPRDFPSGRSRKWSRSVDGHRGLRLGAGRAIRFSAPEAEDVAARLSDHLDTRVRVDLGRRRGPDHDRLRVQPRTWSGSSRLIESKTYRDKSTFGRLRAAVGGGWSPAAAAGANLVRTSFVADRSATKDRNGTVPARAIRISRRELQRARVRDRGGDEQDHVKPAVGNRRPGHDLGDTQGYFKGSPTRPAPSGSFRPGRP